MSAWERIKNSWPQITALVIVLLAVGGSYLEWRLAVNFKTNLNSDAAALKINSLIDARIAGIDIATDQKVVTMDTNIATNTAGVARNKEEVDDVERTLEKVADILMGEAN